MRLRLWPQSEPLWRTPADPYFLKTNRSVFELRIRSGFDRLAVLLVVAEARVSVIVHRPTSWFTWDRFALLFLPPEDPGPVADLTQFEPSSLPDDLIAVLRKNNWNSHAARDARRIHDKIILLVRERDQRLLALPPALAIPWTEPVRDGQWSMTRQGRHATPAGSIDVSLSYEWKPLIGGSASAHWHIVSVRAGHAARQSSGREPLDGVCCDQAAGDLEEWGWPRAEALSIARAIAEKALSDWRALEPELMQAWSDEERA